MTDNDDHKIGECCPDCKTQVEDAYEELAALPTLREKLRSIATSRPPQTRPRRSPYRDSHQIKGKHVGKKGVRVLVEAVTDTAFKGMKLIMTASVENGVQVWDIRRKSDGKSQFPSTITKPVALESFAPNSLSCGSNFDVLEVGDAYLFDVEFLVDCEYAVGMFGPCIREKVRP